MAGIHDYWRAGSGALTQKRVIVSGTAIYKDDADGVWDSIGTGFEGYVPKTRVLRFEAAIAAVNGLGHDRALAAVTIDAAKILGIEKTHGSLEKGKVADLVLYDGDCFENVTHVTHTIINGRIVYNRSEIQSIPCPRRRMCPRVSSAPRADRLSRAVAWARLEEPELPVPDRVHPARLSARA